MKAIKDFTTPERVIFVLIVEAPEGRWFMATAEDERALGDFVLPAG